MASAAASADRLVRTRAARLACVVAGAVALGAVTLAPTSARTGRGPASGRAATVASRAFAAFAANGLPAGAPTGPSANTAAAAPKVACTPTATGSTDPAGDVTHTEGDITAFDLTDDGCGTLTFTSTVPNGVDPATDEHWTLGASAALWGIDVDRNGSVDYVAIVYWD